MTCDQWQGVACLGFMWGLTGWLLYIITSMKSSKQHGDNPK